MGMNRLLIVVIVILALAMAACTRSASVSPTDGGTPGGGEVPFPTPGAEGTPDMMGTLLAGGFATQTAQALGGQVDATPEPADATPTSQGGPVTPQETPTQMPTQAPTAAPTQTSAPATTKCGSPYTVSAGEWVYSIGRKCGLDPQEIISLNNMRPPYLIYPGDKLNLPAAGTTPGAPPTGKCESPYSVAAGEWVYSIARKCGVTPESVISANSLAYPYIIYPGDKLTIP